MDNSTSRKISIVGLGKLGLPLAAAIASRGYEVVGYDRDEAKQKSLLKGEFPYEPGLKELVRSHSERITFSESLDDILETSLTFVIVPTPSSPDGDFSIRYMEAALAMIGKVLSKKKGYHLVAVVSTVLPGSMEVLQRVLERSSKKKCGRSLGLCYNPAFIALGNVIHNFLNPDFVLIGESDRAAGDLLEKFYRDFCASPAPVHRMNFVNAELAKISVNTFITMKISFGNMLARIAERLPGAHADVIAEAIGCDKRISPAYLKGALGYGGPCFPRDNRAFSFVARKVGLKAHSAEATDRVNSFQVKWLGKLVLSQVRRSDPVAILGLSYKPDTDVVEESQGIALAKLLAQKGRKVIVYDPAAMPEARRALGSRVVYAESLTDALDRSHAAVIMTPWKAFAHLGPKDFLSKNGHPKKLIDPWRLLRGEVGAKGFEHIPMGMDITRIIGGALK